jgi:hypothetical protein
MLEAGDSGVVLLYVSLQFGNSTTGRLADGRCDGCHFGEFPESALLSSCSCDGEAGHAISEGFRINGKFLLSNMFDDDVKVSCDFSTPATTKVSCFCNSNAAPVLDDGSGLSTGLATGLGCLTSR